MTEREKLDLAGFCLGISLFLFLKSGNENLAYFSGGVGIWSAVRFLLNDGIIVSCPYKTQANVFIWKDGMESCETPARPIKEEKKS